MERVMADLGRKCIYEKCYRGSSDEFSVFWRIDTNDNGPYISLRLYEDFDKNNATKKDRHRDLYERMSRIMKGIIEEGSCYRWSDVYPGYCGNYKEPSIIHIKLQERLMHWAEEKERVLKEICRITNEF